MKKIRLTQISLLNFKGIRDLTINFDDETNIYGSNGVGKTTIFDAFTWVLFGKDSRWRKEFNIKTLDSYNNPIERIPHEVSVILKINNEEVSLKRCYNEKWTKKRGSIDETFSGHEVECYYNDVPCSVTEFREKIDAICREDVFKLITNPLHFTSQNKDFQRNMLFRLAGEISNEDILSIYPEFSDVVPMLSGKSIEELKKEVAAKKNKIKNFIEDIPTRIDERKRDMPQEQNWSEVESKITELQSIINDIDSQISDRSKIYESITKSKQELSKKLSDILTNINFRELEIEREIMSSYLKSKQDLDNYNHSLSMLENERRLKSISLKQNETELEELNLRRSELLKEWGEIKADVLIIDEDNFKCPTCNRMLETNDIEAKKAKMEEEFNANKAKRLENNKSRGQSISTSIEVKKNSIENIKDSIFKIDVEIEQIKQKINSIHLEKPEVNTSSDSIIIDYRNQEKDVREQLNKEVCAPDMSDLIDKKKVLEEELISIKLLLEDKKRIQSNKERILELEKEYKINQQKLTEYEGIEFKIKNFNKAKIEQIENNINRLFSIVRFKMFETQINGGEVETCEAMVNGVPFSDINKALTINVGIDIINAISKSEHIVAPIFIDNRESISDIIDTDAQIINLIVDSNCKTLKID